MNETSDNLLKGPAMTGEHDLEASESAGPDGPYQPPAEDSPEWVEETGEKPAPPDHDWASQRTLVGKITEQGVETIEVNGQEMELPWWDVDQGTGFVRLHALQAPFDFLLERKVGDQIMIRMMDYQDDEEGNREYRFQTFVHP